MKLIQFLFNDGLFSIAIGILISAIPLLIRFFVKSKKLKKFLCIASIFLFVVLLVLYTIYLIADYNSSKPNTSNPEPTENAVQQTPPSTNTLTPDPTPSSTLSPEQDYNDLVGKIEEALLSTEKDLTADEYNNIGCLYAYGYEVDIDYSLAKENFMLAMNRDSDVSIGNLIILYFYGDGVVLSERCLAYIHEAQKIGDERVETLLERTFLHFNIKKTHESYYETFSSFDDGFELAFIRAMLGRTHYFKDKIQASGGKSPESVFNDTEYKVYKMLPEENLDKTNINLNVAFEFERLSE